MKSPLAAALAMGVLGIPAFGQTTLVACGSHRLSLVMEQVPASWWSHAENATGMALWNRYVDIYRTTASNSSWGRNGVNEFAGWPSNQDLQATWGMSWGSGQIALCMWRWNCECCTITESDIAFNPTPAWTTSRTGAEGNAGVVHYPTALLHELGHSWGLQTIHENYDYDVPTVMHRYYSHSVIPDWTIHAADAYLLRRQYASQAPARSLRDMAVFSQHPDNGLVNTSTNATSYVAGANLTVRGLTVENTGTQAIGEPHVRLFLSTDRTITATDTLIGDFYWSSFPAEAWGDYDLTCRIPLMTPAGTYHVGAVVSADGYGNDDIPQNDGTRLFTAIQVAAAPVTILGSATNPLNGHRYHLLSPATWTRAESVARSLGGHLATVNSQAENDWIVASFAPMVGADRLWIGLNDAEVEGRFRWASGEPFVWSRWCANQPDNSNNEDYVHLNGGCWNDLTDNPANRTMHGVVEVAPESDLLTVIAHSRNPANGHHYFLLDSSSWHAAERAAVAMGGHLVTIDDAAENLWILGTFGSRVGSGHIWLGLNDELVEGQWRWTSGAPVSFIAWCPNQPDNSNDEDYAVTWTCGTGWNDLSETWTARPRHGLVEIPSDEPVVLRTIANAGNGHTYHLLSPSTWSAAEVKARALGGHLVTIDDAAENNWIFGVFLESQAPRQLWIGFSDAGREGAFRWVNGGPGGFTNWHPGEPNNDRDQDFVVADSMRGGAWDDYFDVASAGTFGLVEVEPQGTVTLHGSGCPGVNGSMPSLTAASSPFRGRPFEVAVDGGPGTGMAHFAIGLRTLPDPGLPCPLLVGPIFYSTPVALSANRARLAFPVPLGMLGIRVAMQSMIVEPRVPSGFLMTNALDVVLR